MVMVPDRTSFTNCLTMSFPRSRAASSLPRRPSSTILSSKPFSWTVVAACVVAACFALSAIAALHFGLELLHFVFALHGLEQDIVQFLVPLEAAAQIRELGPQFQQFVQRLDLARDRFRLEIVHTLEVQVDADAAGFRIF